MMRNIKPYGPHILFFLVFVVGTVCAFWLIPHIDSNLYLAIITFLVGLLAFGLYTKQQQDTKREVANIIVSEIRYAEARISEYKRIGVQPTFFMEPILPNNTWSRNHHLYIKDLDPLDEYPLIRDFYNKCMLLDRALAMISSASQLDQKADAMYKGLSEIAVALVGSITTQLSETDAQQLYNIYLQRVRAFIGIFTQDGTAYQPKAPQDIAGTLIQQINPIMNTPAGNKIKKIAGLID